MDTRNVLPMFFIDNRGKLRIHIPFLPLYKSLKEFLMIKSKRTSSKYPLLDIFFEKIDASTDYFSILLPNLGILSDSRKFSIEFFSMFRNWYLKHLPLFQWNVCTSSPFLYSYITIEKTIERDKIIKRNKSKLSSNRISRVSLLNLVILNKTTY